MHKEYPKYGDIILVKGIKEKATKPISDTIVYAQQKKFSDDAKYSHVILCLGVMCIHSVENGVNLISLNDLKLFNTPDIYEDNWVIIRNKVVETNEELQHKIYQRALFHFEKKYNLKGATYNFLLKASKKYQDKVFCSEFIALVYAEVAKAYNLKELIVAENIPPEKTYPYHFQLLIDNEHWYDVTQKTNVKLDDAFNKEIQKKIDEQKEIINANVKLDYTMSNFINNQNAEFSNILKRLQYISRDELETLYEKYCGSKGNHTTRYLTTYSRLYDYIQSDPSSDKEKIELSSWKSPELYLQDGSEELIPVLLKALDTKYEHLLQVLDKVKEEQTKINNYDKENFEDFFNSVNSILFFIENLIMADQKEGDYNEIYSEYKNNLKQLAEKMKLLPEKNIPKEKEEIYDKLYRTILGELFLIKIREVTLDFFEN